MYINSMWEHLQAYLAVRCFSYNPQSKEMESIRPEAARIKELINNYIVSVPSYVLVITGQPGCGKTFTVNNVFEHFQ